MMGEKSHEGDEWHAKLCTAPYVFSTTNSVQGVRTLSREYDTSRQQHRFWRILKKNLNVLNVLDVLIFSVFFGVYLETYWLMNLL